MTILRRSRFMAARSAAVTRVGAMRSRLRSESLAGLGVRDPNRAHRAVGGGLEDHRLARARGIHGLRLPSGVVLEDGWCDGQTGAVSDAQVMVDGHGQPAHASSSEPVEI